MNLSEDEDDPALAEEIREEINKEEKIRDIKLPSPVSSKPIPFSFYEKKLLPVKQADVLQLVPARCSLCSVCGGQMKQKIFLKDACLYTDTSVACCKGVLLIIGTVCLKFILEYCLGRIKVSVLVQLTKKII